jgi:hypothetical protein
MRAEDIRDYVADHPELRSPLCRIDRHPGVAGVAANFVLHVGRRMKRNSWPVAFRKAGAT